MIQYRVKIREEGTYEFTWIPDELTGGYSKHGEDIHEDPEDFTWAGEEDTEACEEADCRKYRYTLSDRPLWVAAI